MVATQSLQIVDELATIRAGSARRSLQAEAIARRRTRRRAHLVQGERGGIAARALATSQMQALSGWRTQAWSHWLTASVTPTAAPWPTLAARAWFAYGAEDVRDSAVCSTDLEPTRVLDQAACRERAVLDVSLGYVRQEG